MRTLDLTVDRKLNWQEFKTLCEQAGIRDNDEIDYISISWSDQQKFSATKDEDFGWQISLGEL